jgi:2-isopropylmalate synthase
MSEQVFIFDTTLRDGEQSPGNTMNTQEKLRWHDSSSSSVVDIIECRLPHRLRGRFRRRQTDSEAREDLSIAGLGPRANDEDIGPALEGDQGRRPSP